MFYAVGYQKEENSKLNFIATKDKKKASKTYDKFKDKKFYRLVLLQYFGKTSDDYSILKQSEHGEDKTFELLI